MNLSGLFSRAARFRGGREGLTDGDMSMTFTEVERSVGAFCGLLRSSGICCGDRLAMMLDNRLEWFEVCFGSIRAGAAIVGLDVQHSPESWRYQLTDSAARVLVGSMSSTRIAGQVCTVGSRPLIDVAIFDEFCEMLVGRARRVRIGGPFETDVDMGPIISTAQLELVFTYVISGIADGADLLLKGGRLDGPENFLSPFIFGRVTPTMRIVLEEIFGPILTIGRFTDKADAIRQANATRYGLAATIWTENIARELRVVRPGPCRSTLSQHRMPQRRSAATSLPALAVNSSESLLRSSARLSQSSSESERQTPTDHGRNADATTRRTAPRGFRVRLDREAQQRSRVRTPARTRPR
jgi:hypothetical protein